MRSRQYQFYYYFPLVFLLFPIIGALEHYYPLWTLWCTLIFAIDYFILIHLPLRYTKSLNLLWLYHVLYIFFMGWMNIGMAWFYFYSISLLTWRFQSPLKSFRTIVFFVSLIATVGLNQWYITDSWNRGMGMVLFIIIVAMWANMRYSYRTEQLKEERYQQQNYINLLTAENERNRIGRDLHDTLGHTFALLTLKTELALKQLDLARYTEVEQQLKDIQHISQSSMADVRRLINDLKERTISEEMEGIVSMFQLSDIHLEVNNQLEESDISPRVQSAVIFILRELTTNVIKHAHAKHCELHLYKVGQVVIEVTDDGRGFSELAGTELHSIRERLSELNGTVTIVSPQHPTQIRIMLEEGVRL